MIILPALLLLGAAIPAAADAPQEGDLVSARLAAEWRDGGEVRVRIDYLVHPDSIQMSGIPVTVLEPSARMEDLTARVRGRRVELEWLETRGRHRGGRILVPPSLQEPGPSGRSELELLLTYTVRGAVGRRIELPLVAVAWPPSEATPGTFFAEVRLPAGVSLYDAFPSGLRPWPDSSRSWPGAVYRAELPVLPAMLGFTTREGPAPLVTAGRAVDAGVVLVLLLLGWAGWRHLRRRLEAVE